MIFEREIYIHSKGELDIVDITDEVEKIVKESKIENGICVVFCPGSTGAIMLNEYDYSLMEDFKSSMKKLIPKASYNHPVNAHSHLRAMLIGPEKIIPIKNGKLQLGTWQQIIFIEFDTRARERKILVKIVER
jgi:secondary thiamine-phosphate synthase enzyme